MQQRASRFFNHNNALTRFWLFFARIPTDPLVDEAGDVLGEGASEFLSENLSQLPNAASILGDLDTMIDPDASAADKAQAALSIANTLRDGLGDEFPELGRLMRSLDSITGSLGAAITLIDPDASLEDKAQAAVELYANVPDIGSDVERIREALSRDGIPDATAISDQVAQLSGGELIPDSIRGQISPELADALTPEQAGNITELLQRGEGIDDALGPVLNNITDPAALDSMLEALDGKSAESTKATLDLLGRLGPDVADSLLTGDINGRPAAEVLSELVDALPEGERATLATMMRDFDADTARRVLGIADNAGSGALGDLLRAMDGLDVNSRQFGRILNDALNVIDRLGVEITQEIAQSVLRNSAKLIPIVGAAPAAYDTARLTSIAADTSLPPELRFLALQGAKANGVDVAASIAEALGVTIPFTTAGSAIIGVGTLVLDVVLEQQTNAYRENPDDWSAPGYVDVAIAGALAAGGPQAALEFALIFGPEGALRKGEELVNGTVDLTAEATATISENQAAVVGEGMSLTAEGLNLLADVIRDPSQLGDAAEAVAEEAVRQLNAVAEGAGELADLAQEQLGNLVSELQDLGEQGVQALQWIASNPGEAASLAADALGNLVEQGLDLATDAGREMAELAMQGLEAAQSALTDLGESAVETLEVVGRQIGSALDSAAELGERGIEFVGWVANNPGEAASIARDALVDVASAAGEYALAATDTLIYIAENPVESAEAVRDAALEGLATVADGVGDAAEAATDALVGFVDQGWESAKSVVSNLLTEGGEVADRIISAWSGELSEGAKEIIEGLANVGGAGIEALGKLSDAGIGLAGDVLGGIRNAAREAYEGTLGRIL